MGLPVKNLRDGTIKVQVANDGGGNAGEVEVLLDEGNLSWSEARPVEVISDRGTLDHARKAAQDQLIELTFSVMYTTHQDPNSAVPTLYEALTRQGAAAGWISQGGSESDDYSVNIEFTVTDPAGGSDEVINFDKMNVTSIDFAEGSPNILTVTGQAPLYWVDFWWTARDGLSPHVGGHGTFTRASTATFLNSDGGVDYARSGEFRSAHHPSATAGRTGLLEAQRSNIATMSETLGGADWAATNVTVGDDDNVGPDGYTTAETLTASAGNGTLIQDHGVLGAVDYVFSIWLKRKTGTGNIDLTLDNGGNWTTKVITSSWARYEITQSVANPDSGIRIVTNADAVYAWGAQVEAAAFSSSYIPTTVYPLSPDGYLGFSGAAGNYASTPDHARLDIVGDIDIRARVALDDWTPAAINAVVTKWLSAANLSYLFGVAVGGALRLSWTTDGAVGTIVTVVSTVANAITDGDISWIRATMTVADGKVNFYTSDDGDNWTLLGAADQGGAGATSIFSGASVLEVGSEQAGTSSNVAGKIYRAQVYDGIAGTLVFDADPQDISTHGVTRIALTEKENSAVVTTFSTSAAATRIADVLFFPLPADIATPKQSTLYGAWIEKGTIDLGTNIRALGIHNAAGASPYLRVIQAGAAEYGVGHHNGTAEVTSDLAAGPSIDDLVEFIGLLNANGSVQGRNSINGAAEATQTTSGANALAAAWSDVLLYVNSDGAGNVGFNAFREIIFTRRTRTLEHLRKVG